MKSLIKKAKSQSQREQNTRPNTIIHTHRLYTYTSNANELLLKMKLLLSLSPLSLLMTVMIGVTYAYDKQLPKLRGAVHESFVQKATCSSWLDCPGSTDCCNGMCCPYSQSECYDNRKGICWDPYGHYETKLAVVSDFDEVDRNDDAFDYSHSIGHIYDNDGKEEDEDVVVITEADEDQDIDYQFLGGASCRRDSNCNSGEVCLKRADRSGYKSSVCFDKSQCHPAGYEGRKSQCCSGFAGGNLATTFCCAGKRCRDIK